jgi:putative exporter of polyketide antibiotics
MNSVRLSRRSARVINVTSYLRGGVSRWTRPLIVIFALSMILASVTTMHPFATEVRAASTSTTPAGAPAAAIASPIQMVEMGNMPGMTRGMSADCTIMCGPAHEMLGAACVLAVLAAVVLFTLPHIVVSRQEPRQDAPVLAASASALAPPARPSLQVLSISRT